MAKERIQSGPSEEAVLAPLACASQRLAGRFAQKFTCTELLSEAGRGGLGKVHQIFGDSLNKILDELNGVLAA